MQQVFLTFVEIHNNQAHMTIHTLHHVLFLQQHLNQEEVLYLGFQNQAKTQIQMSKMQNSNLGFFFFQILPLFF